MGFAVRVRSAGQKYGPTCHQRDRADVTEFVTLVRLSSLGQHVDVLALAGYKRRKSASTAGPIQGCANVGVLFLFVWVFFFWMVQLSVTAIQVQPQNFSTGGPNLTSPQTNARNLKLV